MSESNAIPVENAERPTRMSKEVARQKIKRFADSMHRPKRTAAKSVRYATVPTNLDEFKLKKCFVKLEKLSLRAIEENIVEIVAVRNARQDENLPAADAIAPEQFADNGKVVANDETVNFAVQEKKSAETEAIAIDVKAQTETGEHENTLAVIHNDIALTEAQEIVGNAEQDENIATAEAIALELAVDNQEVLAGVHVDIAEMVAVNDETVNDAVQEKQTVDSEANLLREIDENQNELSLASVDDVEMDAVNDAIQEAAEDSPKAITAIENIYIPMVVIHDMNANQWHAGSDAVVKFEKRIPLQKIAINANQNGAEGIKQRTIMKRRASNSFGGVKTDAQKSALVDNDEQRSMKTIPQELKDNRDESIKQQA